MKKILLFLILAVFLQLPKLSFAQDVPCSATGTVCGQTAYDTCKPVCIGTDAAYDCHQANNPNCTGTIYCSSENSRCSQPIPTPTPSPASSTCQTDCNKCPTVTTCGTKTYDTCKDDKGQFNSSSSFCQNGAQKFRCFAKDNTNCTSSRAGIINEYNYSCSACGTTASTTPSPQPTLTPSTAPSATPLPKKPVKIIISQFERPDQILDPSSNLNEAKLNLNFGQNGVANVRFQVNYDSSGQDNAIYYVQYKLKTNSKPGTDPSIVSDSNTIDTLDYFVTHHPERELIGLRQIIDTPNKMIYSQKTAGTPDPNFYELYQFDDQYIYLREDKTFGQQSVSYSFSDGKWMKRKMKVGEKIAVNDNNIQFYDKNCTPIDKTLAGATSGSFPYEITLESHTPNYDGAKNFLGVQDVIVIKYDYSIDNSAGDYEKFYYSKEWGWIRWELYNKTKSEPTVVNAFFQLGGTPKDVDLNSACILKNKIIPSLSPQPTPISTPEPLKLKDFNKDGIINVFDYVEFGRKKLGF